MEGEKMDLAQAIVLLGRAAQERRDSRRQLVAATDTVARAIAAELRTGDAVELRGPTYIGIELQGGQGHETRYRKALARQQYGEVALFDYVPKSVLTYGEGREIPGIKGLPVGREWTVRSATVEERLAFRHEVGPLLAALHQLMEQQAIRYRQAAEDVVKVAPR